MYLVRAVVIQINTACLPQGIRIPLPVFEHREHYSLICAAAILPARRYVGVSVVL